MSILVIILIVLPLVGGFLVGILSLLDNLLVQWNVVSSGLGSVLNAFTFLFDGAPVIFVSVTMLTIGLTLFYKFFF